MTHSNIRLEKKGKKEIKSIIWNDLTIKDDYWLKIKDDEWK